MTRRMIDSSMWQNEKFAELPPLARLLQLGIINHADDQGRMKANPAYLRARVFPYDDIGAEQVQAWLELIEENGTILLYEVDGKQYLQLEKWWEYQNLQYAQPSDYPRPTDWKDRIRRTLTKGYIITCNWRKVNGDPIPDTCDMNGNPLPRSSNGNGPPPPPPAPPDEPSNYSGDIPLELPEDDAHDSPEPTGEYSPEPTGERTTYSFNLTELNLIKSNWESDLKEQSTHAREAPPPEETRAAHTWQMFRDEQPPKHERNGKSGLPAMERRVSTKKSRYPKRKQSPHYSLKKFGRDGRIPTGGGNTPIEVFYERHSIDNPDTCLSEPAEDDLVHTITDLDTWRSVVISWDMAGYNPRNLKGQLDWYRKGEPVYQNEKQSTAPAQTSGQVQYTIAGML